jgi:putative hemolysin
MESEDLGKLALLVVCLALSAFFSSSETAFIALSRARLLHLISIGRRNAKLVERLISRPERLLATVLLSNNLVNTAAAALGTAVAIRLIDNDGLAVLVSTAGVTVLLLIFSETLPKTVAWNRSEMLAFAYARPLTMAEFILSPGVKVLQIITNAFTRMMGITNSTNEVSEGEIRTLIEVGVQTGAVEQTEAELLNKVFRFGDQKVQEIMTPRTEIVWVEQGMTLQNFLALYAQYNHTRFPVYAGDTENVVGVLSNKDVLLALGRGKMELEDSVTELLREAYFVPETKTVADTFSEMQQGGFGLVLTVDEFGGIAGLVTLKQNLSVIVGQVDEERDEEAEEFSEIDEDTYRLNAGMTIISANDRLKLDLPEGDYQTVAGFILYRLGYIPEAGEILDYGNLKITIRSMNGVRIEEVLAQRTPSLTTGEKT